MEAQYTSPQEPQRAEAMVASYADLPARWSVTWERDSTGLRVTAPPFPSWRYLPTWVLLLGALLLLIVGQMSVSACIEYRRGAFGSLMPGLGINLALYGTWLAALALYVWGLLHHRRTIRVTRDALTVTIHPSAGRSRHVSWPRDRVSEVKFNATNGKMLVRVSGQDLREYPISPCPEVTRWVCDAVRQALAEGEFAPADPEVDRKQTALPRRRLPGWAYGVIALLFPAGVVMACFPATALLGWVLAVAAMMTLGVTFGVQESKFFT